MLILLYLALSISIVRGQEIDWRNIKNGWVIPDETYSDQPYIVKTDDGAWLCILTTGVGKEGQSGQYVGVTRSTDQGKSWSELIPLEPEFLSRPTSELLPRLKEKQKLVKQMELWAPCHPKKYGGMGLNLMEHALVSEALGRCPLGHFVF